MTLDEHNKPLKYFTIAQVADESDMYLVEPNEDGSFDVHDIKGQTAIEAHV